MIRYQGDAEAHNKKILFIILKDYKPLNGVAYWDDD